MVSSFDARGLQPIPLQSAVLSARLLLADVSFFSFRNVAAFVLVLRPPPLPLPSEPALGAPLPGAASLA